MYIHENLTKQNRELLVNAKDWAKGKGFLSLWHTNGKIVVRRKDCDDVFVIRSDEELQNIPL